MNDVILVTGSTDWQVGDICADCEGSITAVLRAHPAGSLVIQGGAKGADTVASKGARANRQFSATIPYAGWLRGAGGPARNKVMVQMAAALKAQGHEVIVHAFGADVSAGTRDCARQAREAGLRVVEHPRRGGDGA